MIHPDDLERLEAKFGSVIPPDIESEYEIRRGLYHGWGASGPLPVGMLVDIMRYCGYGRQVAVKRSGTDWSEHVGSNVVVMSGDFAGKVAKLLGFADNHLLRISIDGGPPIEMSKINLELAEVKSVDPGKSDKKPPSGKPSGISCANAIDWSSVESGTSVIVGQDCEDGEFLEFVGGKVKAKVGGRELSFSPDEVFAGV